MGPLLDIHIGRDVRWFRPSDLLIGGMMDIERVSTSSDDQQANDQSYFPRISGDGRFITFQSLARNLVSGDTNGVNDIFVKDLHSGELTLVSVTDRGVRANGESFFPSISGDGHLVAFQSAATNLVAGDTNNQSDIFLKDLRSGELTRVSTTASGGQGQGMSHSVALSEDGSTAAFVSRASNLVPGDTNGVPDIFVKYLATGDIVCASSTDTGAPANGSSDYGARHRPAISGDGHYVAFASRAGNLSSDDGPGWDIFVKDLHTGAVELASIGRGNAAAAANGDSYQPAISTDGRYVAFTSTASNLVAGDVNDRADVFVKDMVTGAVEMASDAWATATGPGYSRQPAISDDGRYVAFTRVNQEGTSSDVYVKDRVTGELTLLNIGVTGGPSDKESKLPDFSARGGHIAFLSYSTDLVRGDTNAQPDIFVTSLLNEIIGDSRSNTINGSGRGDLIIGLAGGDKIHGGAGNDAVEGGDGDDHLSGDDGNDVLAGHVGNDTLYGGKGDDSLIGGPGNDWLHGGNGQDTLVGGDGNDTLNGFKDTDTLIGGAGADLFVFKAANQSPYGAGDTIEDFQSGVDQIDLRDIGADSFIGTAPFVGGDGHIEVRFDPGADQLQVDVNDNGRFDAGDLEINGIEAVAAGDLLL